MNTDAPTTTHWQSLAAEKIAEMDTLIKRTQATRTWLAEALKRNCKGIDECIVISVDEHGGGMNVTLSCEVALAMGVSGKQKSIKLLTMQQDHAANT